MPLLAWVMSLKTVVPMVTFLGLLSSIAILRTDYRHVVWRDLWRVLPWIALGVAIGVYFSRFSMPPHWLGSPAARCWPPGGRWEK